MRVLFTTNPGLGQLHPLLPLARALREAGHTVAFACAHAFCPKVEAEGFKVFEAGLDWLESDAEKTFPELRRLSLEEQQIWFLRDIFADAGGHLMARDVVKLAGHWSPDLILRSSFEFGGCVAAEKLGIPHATVGIGLFVRPEFLEPLIGDQLAYLRSLHGLQPYPALDMLYRHAYLGFVPPSYDASGLALPPTYHSFRPEFPAGANDRLPDWWDDLPPGRPVVHATLGTVFNRAAEIYRAIIEGLRDEPLNLVVGVGRNQNPADFGEQPPNVRIEQFLPHSLVLPRCDLLITHSGAGTTTQALSHGLPLLMIPLSADQPYQAARCEALGLGKVLRRPGAVRKSGDPLANNFETRWRELSPGVIRDSVREILGNPRYKASAVRTQAELAALPDTGQAVRLLEKLVRDYAGLEKTVSANLVAV
jgi:UDP:flavonoid glycosyltransferase YjiC (YdhE family)